MPTTTDQTRTFGTGWVWDDARLPDWWWEKCAQDDDHHVWVDRDFGYYPYAVLARRLLGVPWHKAMTCVPTCGVRKCVNPQHLLLVLHAGER